MDTSVVCYDKKRPDKVRIDFMMLGDGMYELSLITGQSRSWKLNLNSTILQSLLREACKGFLRSVIPHLRPQSAHNSLPCSSTPRIVEVTSDENATETSLTTPEPKIQYPRARIIALPYNTESKNSVKKRKRVTVASLLGDVEYYTCKECYKSFNRRYNKYRHEQTCGSAPLFYQCGSCRNLYHHPTHFADHLRTHENVKIGCPTCQKQFSTKGSMRAHSRTHKSSKSENIVIPASDFRKDGKRKSAAVHQTSSTMSSGSVRIPIDFKVEM